MLKKISSVLILFFLLSGNIFAYNPTKKDESYIDKVTTKIYYTYKSNPAKIDKLDKAISNYLKTKKNLSERNKYILFSLSSYIWKLKIVMKSDNSKADESLSELMNNIDKLKGSSTNDSFSKLFPEYDSIMKRNDYVYTETNSNSSSNTTNQNNTNNNSSNSSTGTNIISSWNNINFKNTYEVGPNKTYRELQDVPWQSLQKSSIVKIYARENPYYAKFAINVAWTKDEPVVITWVPNENWALPVISWNNALTPTTLDYWNEERSIIKIWWTSNPVNENPSYIYIENLDIKNANPNYTFKNDKWETKTYSSNAAWVHIEYGNNITIKNCKIHDNWNGIFSTYFSSNIIIAWNHIYDNWIVWSIYEHNTYTESKWITYEYNRFWKLKVWALWNNLKDRSSGTIVRYNFIEWWNRQLDLVDSDYQELINANNYGKTYVYWNIFIEPSDEEGNSQFIHYGWDSSMTWNYRNWTLYLYNNTFVSYRDNNPTLVRLSLNTAKAEIINNIISIKSGRSLAITNWEWQINLKNNYLPETWKYTFESNFMWSMNESSNISSNKPWFIDSSNQNFHLIDWSELDNKWLDINSNSDFLKVEQEYKEHQSLIPRTTIKNLGAFE